MTHKELVNSTLDILNCVVSNGRVLTDADGNFLPASIEAEVEYEAQDRFYDDEDTKTVVDMALKIMARFWPSKTMAQVKEG